MRGTNTGLNIEILGINQIPAAPYNNLIINRQLPWLQDTSQENVESRWQATYRDVRILDWQNEVQEVYNLTTFDLAKESNRAALKALFLAVAKASDSDSDGLPDSWEIHYFGNLAAGADQDSDFDGYNNRTEFAFGTNPKDPKSFAPMAATISGQKGAGSIVYRFRRPLGTILNFSIETSAAPTRGWSFDPALLTVQPVRNLYDGTGTGEVECWPTDLAGKQPWQFMRVRAVKP